MLCESLIGLLLLSINRPVGITQVIVKANIINFEYTSSRNVKLTTLLIGTDCYSNSIRNTYLIETIRYWNCVVFIATEPETQMFYRSTVLTKFL